VGSVADLNLLAILVAAIAAFVAGFAYYAVFGESLAKVSAAAAAGAQPSRWTITVEFGRGLILAAVTAGLASEAEIDQWTGGLLLGSALWIGFPLVLWIGAVIHEDTRWRLALIHGGDWLVKLLLVALIVSVWQ
jgi:Protein of unknown function (DUF1761)